MEQMDMRLTAATPSAVKEDAPWASLGLSPLDVAALRRQGFVAAEFRSGHGPYYKLRWRRDGKQQVRYLGRDRQRADDVRSALEVLRTPLRLTRQLTRQLKEARQRLQKVKDALAVRLAAIGLHYHGYAARHTPAVAHALRGQKGTIT